MTDTQEELDKPLTKAEVKKHISNTKWKVAGNLGRFLECSLREERKLRKVKRVIGQ
jgi:hypothetical protein